MPRSFEKCKPTEHSFEKFDEQFLYCRNCGLPRRVREDTPVVYPYVVYPPYWVSPPVYPYRVWSAPNTPTVTGGSISVDSTFQWNGTSTTFTA